MDVEVYACKVIIITAVEALLDRRGLQANKGTGYYII